MNLYELVGVFSRKLLVKLATRKPSSQTIPLMKALESNATGMWLEDDDAY